MATEEILKSVTQLSAADLEAELQKRQAEDKALRALWRAARAKEREEQRQAREAADA
jgi:hypothetical protein